MHRESNVNDFKQKEADSFLDLLVEFTGLSRDVFETSSSLSPSLLSSSMCVEKKADVLNLKKTIAVKSKAALDAAVKKKMEEEEIAKKTAEAIQSDGKDRKRMALAAYKAWDKILAAKRDADIQANPDTLEEVWGKCNKTLPESSKSRFSLKKQRRDVDDCYPFELLTHPIQHLLYKPWPRQFELATYFKTNRGLNSYQVDQTLDRVIASQSEHVEQIKEQELRGQQSFDTVDLDTRMLALEELRLMQQVRPLDSIEADVLYMQQMGCVTNSQHCNPVFKWSHGSIPTTSPWRTSYLPSLSYADIEKDELLLELVYARRVKKFVVFLEEDMSNYASILPTDRKKRSSLPRQFVSPPLLTRSRVVVDRSSSALAAFSSAKGKFHFLFHNLIASIGVIRRDRQAVYQVEREQRYQKRKEYKNAVSKRHECCYFKRASLTEEIRSQTDCFIRSLKGFPLLKVEQSKSKRWIDCIDKLDEAARARFSSSSSVSVADIEQLARVSGNKITLVFTCNGLQRLVRYEHCDNHIQNAEACLLIGFLPGGTMGHATPCTRAESNEVRQGNVQLANEKDMEVINKLLIAGDMDLDPHAPVAVVGVDDDGIVDEAMIDEEVADAPLVVEVAEVSMTVAPPIPIPIRTPIAIPTPTPTPIPTPTSSKSSPIQTVAVVSSTFGHSKVVLPFVLSPSKIDADSRPPPHKKPFRFQYKENTWGRGPPTSIPVAEPSSPTTSVWALGPPTTIPVGPTTLVADVSVWGKGPPTFIPVAEPSSPTTSVWALGPPTTIPVGPTTLVADVSVWGKGPPTFIPITEPSPLSSSPLSSSSLPRSDPVDKTKYNLQRKGRRRIAQDKKKHLHRTLFNRFLILFGHLPSFERTNEKTIFEYERSWRLVAFNNLPGCSVAKCPTGRNSGGYFGGWTIIHAMAASLQVTPSSLQMKLSAYLARCAVIAEPVLQEELFRFLTPADEETVAVLVEHGLPLLLKPGTCTFQHKSSARNSYEDANGTTLCYSITEQVEQLLAKAVDACFEGVEFHVTRLAEEDFPIENLKSIALAQMSVEKTIISLVWEGGNSYAAALIKKGALAEREKQRGELLVAALTTATAAKEAFELSGMCRCRDEARSKRIPTCAIPESCVCKRNDFFCVLGYCGCIDDGLCKSYTASKYDTCSCGKACLPPSPSVKCSTCGIPSHPTCVNVAAGTAAWNCRRCVQIKPRLDLANSFDDQLIIAEKNLQALLFARSVERLDNTAEDVLLFVQKEWNLRVENAEVTALQAGIDARTKLNERAAGDKAIKIDQGAVFYKHHVKERKTFEAEEKKKEKLAAAEDAISAKQAEDETKALAAADLADEEQIERESTSPVNSRWLSFFQNKWGLAGDAIYSTFQSFLEAARNRTQTVFVSGSTSSKIAGFTGPEPGDFDIYTREVWEDGARHAEYEMDELLQRVQLVANKAGANITTKKRAYNFRKQLAPFGKSNSGDILDVTVNFKGVTKPLVLQYLLRNPDWTPLQIVELFYTSHKQVYHLWDGKKFAEEFSSVASTSMREKYCTVSAQRLLQLCGNAVRFLSLTAKEASMLFRSVVGILADTLDPANTDGDKAAVLRLRGKPTPYNKSPVTEQEKKNQSRHEAEMESLSNLLKKRCYFISKDSTSGGGVNARTPEAVTTSLRIISQQLADLASRVYKDSVYGQTFDWQRTLLNLAETCRNPTFAAPITSLIGKKFTPSDLSPLLTDMARKAPERVRTSRVGSKPAPRPTRPRVAKSEMMTTIKRSLNTSVKGTLAERQQIVAKLRLEAETMAVIAPAASRLVASALLYYFNNPGSEPVLLHQKATSGATHLHRAYMMALTGGLQRKGTQEREVNEASSPTITNASKRFFADPRNQSVVYPDRTVGDGTLLGAQAKQMAAELARYYNMEKKSKLHINLGCLMRRTILTLSDTTYFGTGPRKAAWVKFALNGSGKSHAPIVQGLVDEILKVKAKGLKSTSFVALDGVHSSLVKLKLINEKDPIPSFLLDIVKSYSDIFWAKFKGVLPKKMRHADLKALLCEDNNKVECVARLYHHILKLNQSWAAELSDAAKKKENLALGVAELIGDVCPAKDNVNEDEDQIDGLDEELHPELEEDEQEQADPDDEEEEEVDENANMDEEAVNPSSSNSLPPPPPPPALFDPFAQGRGKRELWGKYFYPKSFFLVPQHKKKIRSIAVVGDYIKLAFKDLSAVKSVIAREAQLRKDMQNINEHYMAAIFDRPIRKKESLGASVVTNGHYCSILYNKFGYIPEDMEIRFPQYQRDQNKPLFLRHRDAERFDEPAPGSSIRHWRRIVSVDPGKHNLLTCFEILPNGTERSYKLTQEAYKIATNYERRNARSTLRCQPLTAPSQDGTPGAFQRLCEPDAWGKTADSAAFETHMSIVAAVSPSIFAVTLKSHWADEAFRSWQAKMKCLDRFWSMIKAGSLEDGTFGVQPIFAYGDGQFASSSRGRVSAPTTATYKSCIKINYQCNVILTCEHRSTWTCSSCEKPLQGLRPGNISHTQDAKEAKHYRDIAIGRKNPNRKWFSPLGKILHGLKRCTNSLCPNAINPFLDRDVNACRNILRAFHFADQNPENAETNNPAKPPHMDATNKVLHAAERKAAPKPARLPTRGCYTDGFKVPAGPGHVERHVQRLKARATESILLDSTAPMTGLPGYRSNVFPTSMIDEGKGGGTWRMDEWPLGPSDRRSPPSTAFIPPSPPPSPTRFREEKRERRSAEVLKTMRIYAAVAAGAYPTSSISSFNTFSTSPSPLEFKPTRIIQKFKRFLPYMQTQDFNNLPVQPTTTSSGFLTSGRHNLNSVGRFLSSTTTFPVFFDGFSNLAESLPQQQKSARNGARG
jgi:transposase